MTIDNARAVIRNSIVARYFSLWVIIGLVTGILATRYNVTSVLASNEPITYTKAIEAVQCETTLCMIEKRTMQVHERDALKYLEQSRLTAMTEINEELQAMVYDSPHVDKSHLQK